jgi:hypothetical protein
MNKDQFLPTKHFDSKIDKIREYYADENIKLSSIEDDLRIRLESAYTFLCKFHSNEQTKKLLINQFNYSPAQAYRDIRSALDLFGDVIKTKKEASRYILYEMGMNNYQLAASKTDLEQMNRALTNLIKITGVDRDDFDLPDPSKIQPPVQLLTLTFNFINSEFFKQIDEKAQNELLILQNKINAMIEKSSVKEYLDITQLQEQEPEPDNGD